LTVTIRYCRRADLPALEDDGAFGPMLMRTFDLARRGVMAMLVAGSGSVVIGQIWIDFVRDHAGAVLWALRVRPPWRNRGIGRRLITAGERLAWERGCSWIEIEAELHNARARALYERLGYLWVRRGRAVDAITGAPIAIELDTFRRMLR
jgi:ribosomal protein S18 acetylase RimI-like enzyme